MAIPKGPVPVYRRIAQDAWRIATQHQHLWIFGFFATLIGFGGVSEILLGAYDRGTKVLPLVAGLQLNPLLMLPGAETISAIVQLSPYPLLSLAVFTAVCALFFAVIAWIVTVSIGSVIASVAKISRGGDPTFPEAMREGMQRFLPLFGVNAAMKAVIAVAFFLTGSNLLALLLDSSALTGAAYLATFVLFTAIAAIASILQIFASNAVMIDNDGFVASLRRGWDVLHHHWLISIEMALVLTLVTIFVGFAATLAALIIAVPVIFLILLASAVGAQGAVIGLLTIAAVLALLFLVSLGSFLTTFQSAAWTLLWLDLRKKKHGAQLEHWVAGRLGKK